jgi:hypothetical protein
MMRQNGSVKENKHSYIFFPTPLINHISHLDRSDISMERELIEIEAKEQQKHIFGSHTIKTFLL